MDPKSQPPGHLSLCLCPFNGHFPGGTGLADSRMFPFWILSELRMMEEVVVQLEL